MAIVEDLDKEGESGADDNGDGGRESSTSIRNFSDLARDEISRKRKIVEMPEFVQKKAEMISAHLLLPAYSKVVDMGCETGEVVYTLALLNPKIEFIGIDKNQHAIEYARKTYKLPNLSYRVGDIRIKDFPEESVDAIINSNILHEVYSYNDFQQRESNYNQQDVIELLSEQIPRLKPGGMMLIRDYMKPQHGEYVLLEFPDVASEDVTDPRKMSDADLLIHFSQTARPLEFGGCEGFFLEEIDPMREGTRLFRLEHKWAVEFIHRKDQREFWEKNLHLEYTFFTYQDYQREFARLGMRTVYSAPFWNPWVVKNNFEGRFQMYTEDGTPKSPPATNYFILAQKMEDNESLILEERRSSQDKPSKLEIVKVRDVKSGKIQELAKRPGEYCDLVPYRVTRDGQLVIYVRTGYPRPIVNAVSRGCANIDGKRWSGHLIEPITMDTVNMTDDVDENMQMIIDYVKDYARLDVRKPDDMYIGATYFPAPDRIEESIEPVFMEVRTPQGRSWPIAEDEAGFRTKGMIMELDARDIIRAAQIGLLPEPRLELHVYDLMLRNGITPPPWIGETMPIEGKPPEKVFDAEELLEAPDDVEFEEVKGPPEYLKPVCSVFVEEGKVGSTTRGLSSQDVEFIMTNDGIENVAVVFPLTRGWDNNLLVALEPEVMAAPQRLGGEGCMLNVPSFVLPKNVKTIEDAKAFIAKRFGVGADRVGRLGESYFTHVGLTPQRVYPFVVATEGEAHGPNWHYTAMKKLWRLIYVFERFSASLVCGIARMQMMLDETHDMAPDRAPVALKNKGFKVSTQKVDVSNKQQQKRPPSRILGQRGGSGGGGGGGGKKAAYQPYIPDGMGPNDTANIQNLQQQNRKLREASDLAAVMEAAQKSGGKLSSSYARATDKIRALANLTFNAPRAIDSARMMKLEELDRKVTEMHDRLQTARDENPQIDVPEPPKPEAPAQPQPRSFDNRTLDM